ncbi:hypothetical protein IM725_05485 [Ramlibacter aquaticus]|uniref:Lipoprotein n=1 Tax=Ramlibacter aquaticus TaxID=2780094 RepID=A0ABR9SD92_9BURK|nr:hypothetical protein [Ramlibacter aquaticus]
MRGRRVARLCLLLCVGALLGACGQRGPLYIPSGEASAQRATLPQVLNPLRAASNPSTAGAPAQPTQP